MGVTYKQAKIILEGFLANENQRVLALKGEWGVGKTHLIRALLKKEHHYASVFGLSSIEQVKNRLITSKTNGHNWKNHFSKIVNSLSLKSDSNLGGTNVSGAALSGSIDLILNLYFSSLRNSIFFLDDLERSSNLSTIEIVGLIDYLANELESQVIVVFNESALQKEKSSLSMAELSEKIFDLEVELSPSIEESLEVVIRSDFKHKDIILKSLRATQTNNIRVIRKVKWMSERILCLTQGSSELFRKQVIRNLVVLCTTKYDSRSLISMDDILALPQMQKENRENIIKAHQEQMHQAFDDATESSRLENFGKRENYKKSNEPSTVSSIDTSEIQSLVDLTSFEYLSINDQLIGFVESGYLDEDDFHLAVKALENYSHNAEVEEKIQQIRELMYSNLSHTSEEVKEVLIEILNSEINPAAWYYESIREEAEALDIELFPYEKKSWENLLSKKLTIPELEKLRMHTKNDIFINMIESKIQEIPQKQSIQEVMDSMPKMGWISSAEEVLSYFSEDDYYTWSQQSNERFYEYADRILKSDSNASEKLRKTLEKRAKESRFNRLRIKRMFGIDDIDE